MSTPQHIQSRKDSTADEKERKRGKRATANACTEWKQQDLLASLFPQLKQSRRACLSVRPLVCTICSRLDPFPNVKAKRLGECKQNNASDTGFALDRNVFNDLRIRGTNSSPNCHSHAQIRSDGIWTNVTWRNKIKQTNKKTKTKTKTNYYSVRMYLFLSRFYGSLLELMKR